MSANDNCSHEIKRCLILGRKARTNLSQSVSSVARHVWLRPHESQHARPPCPSPTPGVHSNLRPWSQWCHPAISSSVVTFSSCPQSLPASESFPMSQFFTWGGQSTGVLALASVLPKNKPRQHIKKQRHHFVDKGPHSQSCGFSKSCADVRIRP